MPPIPGVSGRFDIRHLVNDTLPKSDDPIIGTFDGPQPMVSISAIDVGENGARMDAYDAVVGGNLVGSDEFIGTGNGANQWVVLKVLGPAILRFELYQPRSHQVPAFWSAHLQPRLAVWLQVLLALHQYPRSLLLEQYQLWPFYF